MRLVDVSLWAVADSPNRRRVAAMVDSFIVVVSIVWKWIYEDVKCCTKVVCTYFGWIVHRIGIRLEFGVEEEPSFSVKERKSRFLPEAGQGPRPNQLLPSIFQTCMYRETLLEEVESAAYLEDTCNNHICRTYYPLDRFLRSCVMLVNVDETVDIH